MPKDSKAKEPKPRKGSKAPKAADDVPSGYVCLRCQHAVTLEDLVMSSPFSAYHKDCLRLELLPPWQKEPEKCQHSMNLSVRADCCGSSHPCAKCHDAKSDHAMTKATSFTCPKCHRVQPPARLCIQCNYTVSVYYCDFCVKWAHSAAFHCVNCNSCYAGLASSHNCPQIKAVPVADKKKEKSDKTGGHRKTVPSARGNKVAPKKSLKKTGSSRSATILDEVQGWVKAEFPLIAQENLTPEYVFVSIHANPRIRYLALLGCSADGFFDGIFAIKCPDWPPDRFTVQSFPVNDITAIISGKETNPFFMVETGETQTWKVEKDYRGNTDIGATKAQIISWYEANK